MCVTTINRPDLYILHEPLCIFPVYSELKPSVFQLSDSFRKDIEPPDVCVAMCAWLCVCGGVCVCVCVWWGVRGTYRAVLALHAGAVEAQRGDTVADPLDVENTLVAPLARLGLGQVPGLQRDGLHLPGRDQDVLGAHQLRTVLGGHTRVKGQRSEVGWSVPDNCPRTLID